MFGESGSSGSARRIAIREIRPFFDPRPLVAAPTA
jgi:hypothetical protein